MKKGIKVVDKFDPAGWMYKHITKARGKLTIDEIRKAVIDSGDEGYYAVILKCMDDDMSQYYDDDLPDDAVDVYDAVGFMEATGRMEIL